MTDPEVAGAGGDGAPPAGKTGDPVRRVFGSANRQRLLARYFHADQAIAPDLAWRHVYHLLLWVDRTTALAHCYESDKAQPGRPWYARTLAFHGWLAGEFGVSAAELSSCIDWLFREAVTDLTDAAVATRLSTYAEQRAPYAGRGFPEPGEDPELALIIRESLGPWLAGRPPDDLLRHLTRRIHLHLSQENKRRNLVGEGFEDVLGAIVRRVTFGRDVEVRHRVPLHELPGFHRHAPGEKVKKVDLAILAAARRTLVSAK